MAVKTIAQKVFALLFVFAAVSNPFALAHTDVNAPEARDMIVSNAQLILVDVREEFEYCDVVESGTWDREPFYIAEDAAETQDVIGGTGATLSIYVEPSGDRGFYRIATP